MIELYEDGKEFEEQPAEFKEYAIHNIFNSDSFDVYEDAETNTITTIRIVQNIVFGIIQYMDTFTHSINVNKI